MISGYYPSDPRAYLREELRLRKARRSQYSLRAFARDLEMSPSFLSEFLNGHQGMSRDRTLWIGRKIQLTGEQTQHFWDLIESEFGRSNDIRRSADRRASIRANNDESRLSVERFKCIADWYHMPLLELISLKNKNYNTDDFARILGEPPEVVNQAIQRLLTLGLIKKQKLQEGHFSYSTTDESTVTGGEGDRGAIKAFHQQTLQVHASNIDRKNTDKRESLSIAFGISTEDWPAFQAEFRETILAVSTKYATNEKSKDQVIHLASQAYCMISEK